MQLSIYQVDAFADKLFGGNPAAVVPLEEWISDELMQAIAAENNLAETAFFVPTENGFHIRWFTPTVEVDLCGHATIATAYVIYYLQQYPHDILNFDSRSGILSVSKKIGGWLELNFPTDTLQKVATIPPALLEALEGIKPLEIWKGKTDYMAVLEDETQVQELKPNLSVLATVPARGLIVTAKSDRVDFVSRFFAPQSGVPEDPVTGSAHTTLTPYWSERLGKTEMTALQISSRGGLLQLKLDGERVYIAGQAKLYLSGTIQTN